MLETIYDEFADGGNGYLYIEGYANYTANDVKYPINNTFGQGVALDDKDNFCFIQLGTNDRINAAGNIASPLALANNVASMVKLLPMNCEPVIMCAPPAEKDILPDYFDGMRDQLNILIDLCADNKIDLIDNFSIFNNIPFHVFSFDGLHPNDLGYKILASNIINAIINAKIVNNF